MGDNAKLRQDLLSFLMTEWQRKDHRQLVAVDLVYTPLNGFRDEPIRNWVREDDSDLFADFVAVDRLAAQIIEISESEVDAKPPGKHRFAVRCAQHIGTRQQFVFSLLPVFCGNVDDTLVEMSDSRTINTPMLKDTIRVLCQQITELTADNSDLCRELEDARSKWAAVHEKKSSLPKRKSRRRQHA